jgi:hypothetical protein
LGWIRDHYLRRADKDYPPRGSLLPLILRMLTPMAQQDKISILGPRDDGTYVVEFRTAAGERLAISVPSTNATAVLKHFQAATAEPYAPHGDCRSAVSANAVISFALPREPIPLPQRLRLLHAPKNANAHSEEVGDLGNVAKVANAKRNEFVEPC